MTKFTYWQSWLIHFAMLFILQQWSGILWYWSVAIVFAIEVWECSDWAELDFRVWFSMPDTWMDIFAGLLAIFIAERLI